MISLLSHWHMYYEVLLSSIAAVPGDGQAGGEEEMVEGAEQVASDAPSEPVMENGGKKEKYVSSTHSSDTACGSCLSGGV